jgi:molybdate transport system regulatory protein
VAEDKLLSGSLRVGGLDARFFALLAAIASTGSISRAARTVGLSYKGAWLLLEQAGNLAQEPLLTTTTGGSRGGGAQLTACAVALLDTWQKLSAEQARLLATQEARLRKHPQLAPFLRRMTMKTTARNQFAGKITAIEAGPVTTQVTIALKGGQSIIATVTTASSKQMKLRKAIEALALVKASSVVLMADYGGYRLSAANQLEGTVSRLVKGAVSSLVVLTLPGGSAISATVTNEAVEALSLQVGQPATAVFLPSSVIVAVRN